MQDDLSKTFGRGTEEWFPHLARREEKRSAPLSSQILSYISFRLPHRNLELYLSLNTIEVD